MPFSSPTTTSSRLLMILTAITAWVALALQLYILINNTPANGMTPLQAVGRFFIFFTILSNLLVAISLTIVLCSPASVAGRFFARPSNIAAVTLYIFIVGLVYNLVLRSQWKPTGLQKIADELLHVAVPLLFTIYWLFIAPKVRLQWKNVFAWLVFPFAYLVYAMVRGAVEGFYPYPFIDLKTLSIREVVLNCLLVMLAFISFGLLLIAISRIVKKSS